MEGQRAGDHDQLALGERQAPNHEVGIELEVEAGEQRRGAVAHRLPIDGGQKAERAPRWHMAHQHVLRHRLRRHDAHLLRNDDDTGGERVTILEQPRYGTSMLKPDGWSVEDLRQHFKSQLGGRLEPFGLMKNPYPFYDGVRPAEKKS